MGFEWDKESKAGANFRKHGVRMPEAIPVFDDPCAITLADEESDPGEQRFVTVGIGALGRLLVWSILGAARAFESYPPVLPRPTNARNTRHRHERSIRLQQGEAR